jgi:hypothetical protein
MSQPKFPSDLTDALNRAAFRGDARDFKQVFLEESAQTLAALFPVPEKLHEAVETLAFQENAAVFRALADKLGDDPGCLAALVRGFERDEKFNAQDRGNSPYGAPQDRQDLERKRGHLRALAVRLQRRPAPPQP